MTTRNWRSINLGRYNLTESSYAAMLEQQGGICAVCKEPPKWGEYLPVDHKHGTKPMVVRGLLCHRCNKVLGFVRDNPDLLYALARYLCCKHS